MWHSSQIIILILVGAQGASMDCGRNVSLCGVLTLETGLGSGVYEHDEPCVHGLWPETGTYGNSECVAPSGSTADPTRVYTCYEASGDDAVSFEVHEWEKHGECAGVESAEDYFDQVCKMARAPVAVLALTRRRGGDFQDMAVALRAAGYEIFSEDTTNMQFSLSACSTPDHTWVLSAVHDFQSNCGGWVFDDDPSDDVSSCEPNTHGPPCSSDADCSSVPNCVRCAGSGFCTLVPL